MLQHRDVREQSYAEPGGPVERPIPSEQRELNDLLELAERIQASYEGASRMETLLRLLEAVLVVVAAGALVFAVDSSELLGVGTGVALASIAYVLALDTLFVQRYRRRTRRDRHALLEVLDLLRELEGVSLVDTWTPLQRAEFKIRLSRFEIEEPEPPLSRLPTIR
jgi:Flp pilus assembly protein TadB